MTAEDVVIPDEFPTQALLRLASRFKDGTLRSHWLESLGDFYVVLGWALNRGGAFKDGQLIIGEDGEPYSQEAIEALLDAHSEVVGGYSATLEDPSQFGPLGQALLVALIKVLSDWLLSKDCCDCVCHDLVEV